MLKEFTLSLNNTKIVELSLVYWFLQKLPFADSIKEKEREEFQKRKRKKRQIDSDIFNVDQTNYLIVIGSSNTIQA